MNIEKKCDKIHCKTLTSLKKHHIIYMKNRKTFWRVGYTAMKKETLTRSEREIMELLWHVDKPLTASEIIEQSTDRSWKDS